MLWAQLSGLRPAPRQTLRTKAAEEKQFQVFVNSFEVIGLENQDAPGDQQPQTGLVFPIAQVKSCIESISYIAFSIRYQARQKQRNVARVLLVALAEEL